MRQAPPIAIPVLVPADAGLLAILARLRPGMPGEEVEALLGAEPALDLTRIAMGPAQTILLALPREDGCLPRGTPLLCPYMRVHLRPDAAGLPRAARIEGFQPLAEPRLAAALLAEAEGALGPPLLAAEAEEVIRGIPRATRRLAWRHDGLTLEVTLAAEAPGGPVLGLGLVLEALP